MFDEILGKYNNPVKESNATCSTRNSVNECSLNNSNLLITKLDNTHETHNNDSLQLVQKPNYTVIMSIKNIKDSGNTKVLSSHDTSMSFLSGFVPNNLVTILENSNEDTSNSEIYRSFDWSKTYIGKLPKLSPDNVMGKYCTSKTIFTTSDINDSETSLSSNISNDIEIEKIDNGNNVNNED
ncbi:hypothetical protein WH47_08692 [Habropoda laboriosa]|uniref:Uncharacterized protein n=1 Tax=Habropoda laboriosa TaxID=597456 RepID=A0A0L7QNX2_9HYME|nr:hypothetical protein WH47_08692 [Habropoda laboriosa]